MLCFLVLLDSIFFNSTLREFSFKVFMLELCLMFEGFSLGILRFFASCLGFMLYAEIRASKRFSIYFWIWDWDGNFWVRIWMLLARKGMRYGDGMC